MKRKVLFLLLFISVNNLFSMDSIKRNIANKSNEVLKDYFFTLLKDKMDNYITQRYAELSSSAQYSLLIDSECLPSIRKNLKMPSLENQSEKVESMVARAFYLFEESAKGNSICFNKLEEKKMNFLTFFKEKDISQFLKLGEIFNFFNLYYPYVDFINLAKRFYNKEGLNSSYLK